MGKYCCVNEGKVSLSSRRDLAAMVSNTNDDFPDPDTPVTTVICRFGILTVTCFRLFSVASLMRIKSNSAGFSIRFWVGLVDMAHLHFGHWDFIFCHSHQVSIKNHEIGVFPDFYAAFAGFKEAAFGHPYRDGAQGLFAG